MVPVWRPENNLWTSHFSWGSNLSLQAQQQVPLPKDHLAGKIALKLHHNSHPLQKCFTLLRYRVRSRWFSEVKR